MIRTTTSVALAAVLLTACNAELNTGSQGEARTGLSQKPAIGATVQLFLVGGGNSAIGTVTGFEDDEIVLRTQPSGLFVTDWREVVAWESGESVELRSRALESLRVYRAETNERIAETAGILPE